jgi:GTP pyrophosphokinase
MTISQLNKIGARLRKNQESDEDLRALDEFRLSFEPAYQQVFDYLTRLGLRPGGRSGKTTLSIRAKLIRERTRLSRMQDIAGCRVIVENVAEQNKIVGQLIANFPEHEVFDRRESTSHGYRAVHFVAYISGVPVEIQVRTSLQHAWAELSEKLSDVDPMVKYGGGPESIRVWLDKLSEYIGNEEIQEEALRVLLETGTGESSKVEFEDKEEKLRARKLQLHEFCREFIIQLQRLKV